MKTDEVFEALAAVTWRTLHSTHSNRVLLGEDAITSYNLNTLACVTSGNVVFEDTRVDEATRGCDFELWVGANSTGWYRYAVQAKKINVRTGKYDQLAHEVGGVPQLDILEKYASANNALALYCFYNYSTLSTPWNCSYYLDIEQLGCSITPSHIVRSALKKRGARCFSHIHEQSETLPWRCLVKCPKLVPCSFFTRPLHFYPQLPISLQKLQQLRLENAGREKASREKAWLDLGLFDSGSNLLPRYVVVIERAYSPE